jgi:hypothetical protein
MKISRRFAQSYPFGQVQWIKLLFGGLPNLEMTGNVAWMLNKVTAVRFQGHVDNILSAKGSTMVYLLFF